MENPVEDIAGIVHTLTQGTPKRQEDAITKYFTNDAKFTHPFCGTGSFNGSRASILAIFRWYKILSPRIELSVNSIAFDEKNLILYVGISQVFAVWFIPFYRAPVTLTTVLQLTKPTGSTVYHIKSQNDLYQVDQFVRFVAPWGIGHVLVLFWHFWATFFCIIGARIGRPLTMYMQNHAERQETRSGVNGVAPHETLDTQERKRLTKPG
ncbi:uncharacterized protein RCC_04582 [Ramularia collo-cygni]|uniref:SigF-like NTF2-like domain-containing protein n=1 Tax=Ramularia collo-cygni TaxID=112498 RepID=A0A2D3UUB8_9PEZI|nr:uncharacterized protein RCC_04582 [Ramularia collo-cygni]CZT18738.1 uncharacterized protein RCC_04582 [Ramularia collo-cygni]